MTLMLPMFTHGVYENTLFRSSTNTKMLYFFILIVGVLKCQPTINREDLRTKLLDAQNVMRFDQVEFDRLWNLGMSNGNFQYFDPSENLYFS